jgi:type II secretory pathway pseudopilin PulG
MRRRRRAAGISLLEVLVAAALLATAVVATAASVLESAEHQRANARIRAVTPAIASLLEEVRGAAFDDLATLYGGTTRTLTDIPEVKDARATYTVTDVATGSTRWAVKKVDVVVTWTGPSGTVSTMGTTYVADSVEAEAGT